MRRRSCETVCWVLLFALIGSGLTALAIWLPIHVYENGGGELPEVFEVDWFHQLEVKEIAMRYLNGAFLGTLGFLGIAGLFKCGDMNYAPPHGSCLKKAATIALRGFTHLFCGFLGVVCFYLAFLQCTNGNHINRYAATVFFATITSVAALTCFGIAVGLWIVPETLNYHWWRVNGHGIIYHDGGKKCMSCNGRGNVYAPSKQTCSKCEGSGWEGKIRYKFNMWDSQEYDDMLAAEKILAKERREKYLKEHAARMKHYRNVRIQREASEKKRMEEESRRRKAESDRKYLEKVFTSHTWTTDSDWTGKVRRRKPRRRLPTRPISELLREINAGGPQD